jgi:transmembrane sensor
LTDLARATALIRQRVKVDWDDQHVGLFVLEVESRMRRRRARMAITLSVALAAAASFALYVGRDYLGRDVSSASPQVAAFRAAPAQAAPAGLRFSDGSVAIPIGAGSKLAILEDTPSSMLTDLSYGQGRFRVMTDGARMFGVRAGNVMVIAIGTEFTVSRREAQVDVAVAHGRVRVEFPGGVRELGTGESDSFDTEQDIVRSVEDLAPVPSVGPPKSSWQSLAAQRRFSDSYALLGSNAADRLKSAKELMLAADVARLSGHPEEAAGYLNAVLRRYPNEFSAQMAAFSLGRIYLELQRPDEAARRFGDARRLAGSGALAQDALARQVEALSRAGKKAQARARAEEYVRLFPDGARVSMVRKWGGLP